MGWQLHYNGYERFAVSDYGKFSKTCYKEPQENSHWSMGSCRRIIINWIYHYTTIDSPLHKKVVGVYSRFAKTYRRSIKIESPQEYDPL